MYFAKQSFSSLQTFHACCNQVGEWNFFGLEVLEVGFKPNSTLQDQLVKWDLHLTYILWISLISSRRGTTNTPPHAEVYSSHAWTRN